MGNTVYTFDTEFHEDGYRYPINLLSIGIKCVTDGRTYYAQVVDTEWTHVSDWVAKNVLTKLSLCPTMPELSPVQQKERHINGRCRNDCPWDRRAHIAASIEAFCKPSEFGKPEFWAWFGAYDWVLMCQLFGELINLPSGWPAYCNDLKQWCVMTGNHQVPLQNLEEKHHALMDAIHDARIYEFLQNRSRVTRFIQ